MEKINKLSDIEDKIAELTLMMLDLDPNAEENQDKVRIAWPTSGAPGWSIDEDICFLRITPVDSPSARQQDVVYTPKENSDELLTKEIAYTRVHNVDWCFYGPNAYDLADVIRFKILSDTTIKKEFNNINLHLVTDVTMPIRVPELFQGRWWNRVDFQAKYNELVVRSAEEKAMVIGNLHYIIDR